MNEKETRLDSDHTRQNKTLRETERYRQERPPTQPVYRRSKLGLWIFLTVLAVGAVVVAVVLLTRPERVTVPNLVYLEKQDAERLLDPLEIDLAISGELECDSVEPGNICDQNPKAGKKLARGETVLVYLSKETSDTTPATADTAKTTELPTTPEIASPPSEPHTASSQGMPSGMRYPSPKVQDVSVGSFDTEGFNMGIALNVDNPNSFITKVRQFNYDVYVDGNYLGSGVHSRTASIGANGSSTVNLGIKVRYDRISDAAKNALKKGSATYRVKGNYEVEAQGGKERRYVDHSKTLDLASKMPAALRTLLGW